MRVEIVPGIVADPICAEYDLTIDQVRAVLRGAAWLAAQQLLRAS
jgi:hypothetical protein